MLGYFNLLKKKTTKKYPTKTEVKEKSFVSDFLDSREQGSASRMCCPLEKPK